MGPPTNIEILTGLINQLTATVNEYSHRMEKLYELADSWIVNAQNESLTEATRTTYLECAESVARIMVPGTVN